MAAALLSSLALSASSRIGAHYWLTPNQAFLQGKPLSHFVQPTQSGNLTSALWGCVRNGGARFHEGLDLKPIRRDSRGEALDSIYAFDAGVVQYVNRDADASSYGRYIVVEHGQWMPGMVSLYAHLSAIPSHVKPGLQVDGGEVIGQMGRSASYSIPRERAHLHFEVGLWLGPRFQRWYDIQRFKTPNDHGVYNGMNIVGLDVWELLKALRSGEVRTVMEYVATLPVAVSATVWDNGIPDLLQVNPELMVNALLPTDHAGWRIDFAASGVPIRFEALSASQRSGSGGTTVRVADSRASRAQPCIELSRGGVPSPRLNATLERLFVK